MAAPVPYTAPASTALTLNTAAWHPASGVAYHYKLLPYSESLRQAGQYVVGSSDYGLQTSKFRVLSTQAKISYIGNDFNNQGVAATARLAFQLDDNLPTREEAGAEIDQYYLMHGSPLPQDLPDSFSTIAALPGARSFPITQAVNMINAPMRFDYQPVKDNWAPFVGGPGADYVLGQTTGGRDIVFGGLMNNVISTGSNVIGSDGIGGIGYAPVTFFAATGLAPVADNPLAIMVEARCCIEYTLAYTSPSARFARLPPPERPLAIRQVHDFGRVLPSSVPATAAHEQVGWLHRFWDWYWPKEKAAAFGGINLGLGLAQRLAGLSIGGSQDRQGMLRGRNQLAIGY